MVFSFTEEPPLQGAPYNSSAILLLWKDASETKALGYFIYYENAMEGETGSDSDHIYTVSTTKRVRSYVFLSTSFLPLED